MNSNDLLLVLMTTVMVAINRQTLCDNQMQMLVRKVGIPEACISQLVGRKPEEPR